MPSTAARVASLTAANTTTLRPAMRLSRQPSRVPLTVRSWWRGLRDDHEARNRFSIIKAAHFIAYARTMSPARQLAVVLLFPLPGVLAALALPLIPLQNPTLGPLENWGSWLHIYGVNWIAMASGLIHTRAVSEVPRREYSTCAILSVATIAALPATAFYVALGVLWRFPIPFFPVFAPFPFVVSLVAAHAFVFRGGRLGRAVRTQLVLYVPSLSLQVSQLTIYPVYSAVFAAANDWQQIVLVLLFPLLKYVLRRMLFTVSRHLRDFAQEIAFCGVEICASTYQAAIMQSTPSSLVTALVIAIDVALNVWGIKRCMDHVSVVPGTDILTTAVGILQDTTSTAARFVDQELAQFATERPRVLATLISPIAHLKSGSTPTVIVPTTDSVRTAATVSTVDTDKVIVTHALELLQAAESVLLVEYLEVAVPMVNALFLVVASQLPSATYNSKLRQFHADPCQLVPAVASIFLYTSLQALTVIAMCVVMHFRYRLSALTLLAFVIETHAWSLHGMLVMWLVAILAIPVIHYGVDFTFQFGYTPLPVG